MPVVWTESQTLKLVILYSQHECLTNPFHRDFRDKLCRYKAYKEVVHLMNICGLTVCDCIKRITYVKAQYCYELSKISAAISCEKFYKPQASWFPVMHQVLFPYVKTFTDTYQKTHGDEKNTLKDFQLKEPSRNECNPPHANCHCNEWTAYKSKPYTPSKKHWSQLDNEKLYGFHDHSDSVATDYFRARPQKVCIDAGINTARHVIADHETQTESTPAKDQSVNVKYEPKHACDRIGTSSDRKEKGYDEFDMFGKSIASQLRNINCEVAIKLEKRIQDLIAEERLDGMKSSKCVSHGIQSESGSSCSECKVITHDRMICSCGLPVIMINADSSCEFHCK